MAYVREKLKVHTKFCKRCDGKYKGPKYSRICPKCRKPKGWKKKDETT